VACEGEQFVVLELPLLFESGKMLRFINTIIVVHWSVILCLPSPLSIIIIIIISSGAEGVSCAIRCPRILTLDPGSTPLDKLKKTWMDII